MLRSLFFKPKWKHADPAVRCAALEKLNPSNPEHLDVIRLLLDDPDPQVRERAIALHPDDLLEFETRLQSESAPSVQAELRRRVLEFLLNTDSPEVRERISPQTDPALIEALLKRSPHASIRKLALEQVDQDALFEYVVIHDEELTLKIAALERVESESRVERIIKHFRSCHKELTRLAKERAQALIDARLGPIETERIARQITVQLDAALSQGYHPRLANDLEQIERQWESLAPPPLPELETHYRSLRLQLNELLVQHQLEETARIEREQALEENRERCVALLEELTNYLDRFELTPSSLKESDPDEFETGWEALYSPSHNLIAPFLDPSVQSPLKKRWTSIQNRYTQQKAVIQRFPQLLQEIQTTQQEIEQALKESRQLNEQRVNKLRDRVKQLAPPEELAPLSDYDKLLQALKTLQDHLKLQKKRGESFAKELPQLLDQLDSEIAQGNLNTAQNQLKSVRKRLDFLPPKSLSNLRTRFSRQMAQVRELEDWQGYATHPKREQLCVEMESLIEADIPPEMRAKQIKALQDQWKELGKGVRETTQPLWKRFHQAADEAYEPCREYYAAQRKEREANLAQRETICEQIETQIAWLKENEPDWILLDQFIRQAYREWRECGPTHRRHTKEVGKRFISGINALKAVLNRWHQENRAKKERLIKEAEELLNEEDTRLSTRLAKEIQQAWREVGSAGYRTDRALWRAFRKVSDQIFDRREHDVEAHQAKIAEATAKQIALFDQFEKALAQELTSQSELEEALVGFETAWKTLRESHPLVVSEQGTEQRERPRGSRESKAIRAAENRFRKLVGEAQKKITAFSLKLQAQAERADWERALLCDQYESLLIKNGFLSEEEIRELVEKWESLGEGSPEMSAILTPRFERLRIAKEEQPAALDSWIKGGIEQLTVRRAIALDLEILADAPSPAPLEAERMRRKVERLEESLRTIALNPSEEIAQLREQWYASAFIPPEEREGLNARFERAIEALSTQSN
jgi:exonuclease SbcC